jgi:hypothetical protein
MKFFDRLFKKPEQKPDKVSLLTQEFDEKLGFILSNDVLPDSRSIPVAFQEFRDSMRYIPSLSMKRALYFKVSAIAEKCLNAAKSENDGAWFNGLVAYRMFDVMEFFCNDSVQPGTVKWYPEHAAEMKKWSPKRDAEKQKLQLLLEQRRLEFGVTQKMASSKNPNSLCFFVLNAIETAMKNTKVYNRESPLTPGSKETAINSSPSL